MAHEESGTKICGPNNEREHRKMCWDRAGVYLNRIYLCSGHKAKQDNTVLW